MNCELELGSSQGYSPEALDWIHTGLNDFVPPGLSKVDLRLPGYLQMFVSFATREQASWLLPEWTGSSNPLGWWVLWRGLGCLSWTPILSSSSWVEESLHCPSRCSVVLTAVTLTTFCLSHTCQPHQVEILDHIHMTQRSLCLCRKHEEFRWYEIESQSTMITIRWISDEYQMNIRLFRYFYCWCKNSDYFDPNRPSTVVCLCCSCAAPVLLLCSSWLFFFCWH